MSEKFQVSVLIKANVSKVWESLVDWQSQSKWMALTKVTSSSTGESDSGIGTTIEAFTGIGKFGILDIMRIDNWQPPTFCSVIHEGKWIKGVGEFSLISIGENKTRFDWFEEIHGPRLLLLMLKPGILLAVQYSLRKFARTFRP